MNRNSYQRVTIQKRKLTNGKTSYHLRWFDREKNKRVSKPVGTDSRFARDEQRDLEKALNSGTYREIKPITWSQFTLEYTSGIRGKANRSIADRTLKEFGEFKDSNGELELQQIRIDRIMSYVSWCYERGNRPSTINKKIRYLKAAFKKAIKLAYLEVNPFGDDWKREAVDHHRVRVIDEAEEKALLEGAERLYGERMRSFIYVALRTGARRGELLGLSWSNVDLDDQLIVFVGTKTHRDRAVPINPDVSELLRNLYPTSTTELRDGGPFIPLAVNIDGKWKAVRKAAGFEDVTIHDLRRTAATRMIRSNVPVAHVAKVLGHRTVQTTLSYYNDVDLADMRAAVKKLA